jgi:ABC-type Fe3+/spermidine/putrescine transport system ATPase subunit
MLEVKNISKDYEGKPLLIGVSFVVNSGETVCLLGPSGSGKSTLLRIISGLEPADSGSIFWQGKDLNGVAVHLRNFGLMFQDYALFPHKNVFDNVAFGLKMQRFSREQIQTRVESALKQVGMESFVSRRVTDLSGGEQQRVAFARSLAPRPGLLMLDEPLGALDRSLREQLMEDLRHLLHETRIPAIYVTHDQEEAFTIADRLLLLHDGQIIQQGTPEEVYNRPNSVWVAKFLGMKNLINGKIVEANPLIIETQLGVFKPAGCNIRRKAPGTRIQLLINSKSGKIVANPNSINSITGIVEDVFFRGEGYRVQICCKNELRLEFLIEKPIKIGQTIHLKIDPDAIECFR